MKLSYYRDLFRLKRKQTPIKFERPIIIGNFDDLLFYLGSLAVDRFFVFFCILIITRIFNPRI